SLGTWPGRTTALERHDRRSCSVPYESCRRHSERGRSVQTQRTCIIELMSVGFSRETSPQNVVEIESQYVLQTYARHPLILVRGDGPWMWDHAGKQYLDFIAGIGVNALGQNHPRIVRVIQEQAARLIHTSNLFYNEYQGPLAKRIAEVSGLQRTFFCNS